MKNLVFKLLILCVLLVGFLAFNYESLEIPSIILLTVIILATFGFSVNALLAYLDFKDLEEDILMLQHEAQEIEESNEHLRTDLKNANRSVENLRNERQLELSNVIYLADRYDIKLKIETNEAMEVSVYRYPQYSIKETAKVDNQKQAVEFIIHKVAEYFPENEFNTYFSKKGFDL